MANALMKKVFLDCLRIRLAGRIVALLAFVSAPLSSGTFAKDLEMLTRLLIPAYTAQNFSALCVDQDAQFLSDLPDGMALIGAFAEHVKNEVTLGLSASDAGKVRVMAADTARSVARHEMQLLGGQNSDVPAEALKRWCGRSAKHFIVEMMTRHRARHKEFEKLMETAKHRDGLTAP